MNDQHDGLAKQEFLAPTGALVEAPLSSAMRAGGLIFVSGQIAIGDHGAIISEDAGEQTRGCLEIIKALLEQLDSSMTDVVQTRIYLTDWTGYANVNRVYQEFFAEPFPTRSTVGASDLAFGASVEIEAIARC